MNRLTSADHQTPRADAKYVVLAHRGLGPSDRPSHDYQHTHRLPWVCEHTIHPLSGGHSPQTELGGLARTGTAGINSAETVLLDPGVGQPGSSTR